MSDCKANFNKSGKVFCKNCQEINDPVIEDCCECNRGCECNMGCDCNRGCGEDKNPCTNAPTTEPRLLTLLSNAVFDETGINLCKSVTIVGDEVNVDFSDFPCARNLLVNVIDLYTDDSTINYLECKPNCVRVRLRNLQGKFEGKLVDGCGNVLIAFIFYATFLSDSECGCDCDCKCGKIDTNPESICTDLYAPNGVSYDGETPVVTFLGFDVNNDSVRQGINLQAEAKVLKLCVTEPSCGQCSHNLSVSLGMTLVLRSVYTVEYKFSHQGISIPPKAAPIELEEDRTCEKFVRGDLISKRAKPLEFDTQGRTIGTGLVDGGNKGCCR